MGFAPRHRAGKPPKHCSPECRRAAEQRRRYPLYTTAMRMVKKSRLTESGCIEWVGYTNAWGYGVMTVDSKQHLAHRMAWSMEHGDIPTGMFVCHHCDNPPCINTEHLFLGTAADNAADRDRKGRGLKGRTKAKGFDL